MKLVVISHTGHAMSDGDVVGLSSTLREIDQLAGCFDEVVHVAPLSSEEAPANFAPYRAKVRLAPVLPSGGSGVASKLRVVATIPRYVSAIVRELRDADVVHVRAPANISLVALVVLFFKRRPRFRWVKYAGNWRQMGNVPLSYRFQRWFLTRGLHRGIVTINGSWPDQPRHVHTFENPSISDEERERAGQQARAKTMALPLRLLFVGRIERAKGIFTFVEVIERLRDHGIGCVATIAGDGPARTDIERRLTEGGLQNVVRLVGWASRDRLDELYAEAHALLLPSASEGWPKVVAEAMAAGAVPLVSEVSALPKFLSSTGAGLALPREAPEKWVEVLEGLVAEPERWEAYRDASVAAAAGFTYGRYLEHLQEVFSTSWGIHLPCDRRSTDT